MPDDTHTETHVVTVFLRHDADVLLLRRSDEVGSYSGRWGGVAGHAEGDPESAAREEICEETGLDPDADVTLLRQGKSFEVVDADLGKRWIVHPFLFAARTRDVTTNYETAAHEWVSPTEIFRRETVPDLWRSYDRVRPTVETVAGDRARGSTALSVCALEVLRDEAALAVECEAGGWAEMASTARALRDARPAMVAVANRVNRAMAAASDEATPEALERAAIDGIDRALAADEKAAARATERLPGRVATLSRSGTVLAALTRRDPAFVLVAESRPGREGVATAEQVATETDAEVTITTDAAFGEVLAERDVGALVVGADAVLPNGRVINKVGTRGAVAVASAEGVDCYVVTASDKVRPTRTGPGGVDGEGGRVDDADEFDREKRDPTVVYDGDADLDVDNPAFGATPVECIDAVVTEDGPLDDADVREVADAHRRRAAWDDG